MKAKKIFMLAICGALAISLTACKHNSKLEKVEEGEEGFFENQAKDSQDFEKLNPTIYTYEFWPDIKTSDGSDKYVYIKRDIIELSKADAQNYPELQEALKQRENAVKEEAEVLENNLIEETVAGDFYTGDGSYHDINNIEIVRADQTVLSFIESHTKGNAVEYTYVTIDSETGKELTILEVAKTKDIKELVANALSDGQPAFTDEYIDDILEYNIKNGVQFVVADEDVEVLLNVPPSVSYEPEPFQLVACMPFGKYPNAFDEKYQVKNPSYIRQLGDNGALRFDVDHDGTFEGIKVMHAMADEYGTMTGLELTVGDVVYSTENTEDSGIYYYSKESYVVVKGQKTFVYNFLHSDNDWVTIEAFDITDKNIKPIKQDVKPNSIASYCADYSTAENNVYVLKTYAFINPSSVELDTHMDLLSTYSGHKEYSIADDGKLETNDAYFMVESNSELTLKKNMKFDVVDKDGKVTGSKKFEKGSIFRIYRNDGESIVDLKTEDGTIVRLQCDKDGWPRTVNGIEEEELFDGVIYAG